MERPTRRAASGVRSKRCGKPARLGDMGNLRDPVDGRRVTAAVGDHGGGESTRRGMVISRGIEITTLCQETQAKDGGWDEAAAPRARGRFHSRMNSGHGIG